jgi:hypothetical protein
MDDKFENPPDGVHTRSRIICDIIRCPLCALHSPQLCPDLFNGPALLYFPQLSNCLAIHLNRAVLTGSGWEFFAPLRLGLRVVVVNCSVEEAMSKVVDVSAAFVHTHLSLVWIIAGLLSVAAACLVRVVPGWVCIPLLLTGVIIVAVAMGGSLV